MLIKVIKIFKFIYKHGLKIIKFDNTIIEEYKIHENKCLILVNDIDINKTVVFYNLPFGKQDFKCFIGYKDLEKNRALFMFCP